VGAATASRSDIATKLRLASGLVLMAYACTHLINHTLGIHSLAAMEAGGRIFTAVWRAAPATLLLYAAFAIHVVLAVHKLWRRRSLKMPAWEMAQVVLGFLIPFWLVVHIIGTRGSHQFFGVDDTYGYVLNTLWPDSAYRHSFMLVLVWLHGCIGVHFWPRLRPRYRALQPWLFALALVLPTLALIGFADAGRELRARAASDPAWLERLAAAQNWLDPSEMGWIYATERQVLLAFTAILLATLRARGSEAAGPLPPPRPALLSGRCDRLDRARHERARGEPGGGRAPCLGLRRPRPLLDLSGAPRGRRRAPAAAGPGRGARARPDRRPGPRPPGLPAAADQGSRGGAPAAGRRGAA
jgi:hypothetical protein